MFLSLFFLSIWGSYSSDLMEKHNVYEKTLIMHLNILDKIATEMKKNEDIIEKLYTFGKAENSEKYWK